ncbi:MAG: L-2-amino-thiazoline-4-carboxylic acid hydrolase [Clostridia bacterium]|nr:L-2-amino-thiazoline-4-carboxylic acid hydrolase [Clostridia bacterium]
MRYSGMPSGMWLLFAGSYGRALTGTLGLEKRAARDVMRRAKARYREIILSLPEFEKGDRFKTNIVGCALFCAVLLQLPSLPEEEVLVRFYARAQMTWATRLICKIGGRIKFSKRDIEGMERTARRNAADRNPYSWNMTMHMYPDGSGYEARFSHCGICTLMRSLGLGDAIAAMCHFDYDMSEAGGRTRFVRKYTLASGGPYCDCGYIDRRKEKA